MTFSEDIARFNKKLETKNNEVFLGIVDECQRSIVEGSEITAAPGQPVDTGALRASWQKWFVSPTEAKIATNLDYAPHVEDNVRGVIFKNHGPHSVKLTYAGFQRIVDVVTRRVSGS